MEAIRLDEDIFCIKNFMSKADCQKWIEFSEKQGYELAKVNMGFGKQVVNKAIRNNERFIYDNEELASELWDKIRPFVILETEYGIACGLNERFRFYKYKPGQQFRSHIDGSYIRSIKEWSSYTLLIYLNEEMEGGATEFPQFYVEPKTGTALIFKHEVRHAGKPIHKGIKYVLRTDIMYKRKQ
ncbi:prolyl hydroxylase family protein [Aureispira anguillae]|uniref:2OG-Fe(II) oxygenase n=1 Tax=Aureispira anguillae TaxID=2864201 RepID=A0A915YE73_9BACT|nr:2OG-Fe(II) oxygenase [Aureispira anguillae]BDS11388.1 2OG-Fe(II) oxygenase [Aureispira anguillae]